jgi:3alpha(or 20beta)-hydroxysteroid dehydrogenase
VRLKDKVAIVTGGARGMGAATVRAFAAEGAKVIVGDILDDEGGRLAEELGGACLYAHLDVGDEVGWAKVAKDAEARFGEVDILVNNAGRVHFATLLETQVADFEAILRTNLIGSFLGIRTVAPLMLKQGAGSIVNVSSIEGLRGLNGVSAYAASKWGVRGLTKTAALELGPLGVRVNSVHPGGINTPMGNPMGRALDEVNKGYQAVPLQRIGEPSEVALASLFLASDDSSYVNGAELVVDGGWVAGDYIAGAPGSPAALAS